jgi:hypothetical protein
VRQWGENPTRIFLVDLATGKRTPWKEISPPDSEAKPWIVALSRDGRSYAYSYGQVFSDLFLVEGLR